MALSKTDPRQKLVRLIHVAKRDLNMDDDVYRAILLKIGKTESSSKMTVPELERTLEHMKRCGFKVRSKISKNVKSRPLADDAESKKIRALWIFLHEMGLVRNSSEAALAAYVKRMTGVETLQWLDREQAKSMIESLKKWAMRVLPAQVKALADKAAADIHSGKLQLSKNEIDSLNEVYGKSQRFRSFDPIQEAWYALMNAFERGDKHEYKK